MTTQFIFTKYINTGAFYTEIGQPLNGLILGVEYDGAVSRITFSRDLTTQEETDLTAASIAHPVDTSGLDLLFYDSLPVNSPFYSTDKKRTPYDFDFTIDLPMSLYKEVIFDSNTYPVTATYYLDYDGTTYSNPLFKRDFIFTYDAVGLIAKESIDFSAIQRDSVWKLFKTTNRFLTPAEQLERSKLRRKNVIDILKPNIVGMYMATVPATQPDAIAAITASLVTYDFEIKEYITWNTLTLADKVTADTTYLWFDNDIGGGVTIRDVILGAIA